MTEGSPGAVGTQAGIVEIPEGPLGTRCLNRTNLVEQEASPVENRVKALQAAGTAYPKVQRQERACVWEHSSSVG